MRLTTILLIVSLLQVSAAGLAQKVTVVANKAPLENVLRTIRMQSGYDIFYDGKDLVGSAPVNISVHDVSAEQAIMLALEKQALTYTIEGNVVVITRKVPSVLERVVTAFSQMEVQGRVVDEKGNPLSGANIWISGSNRGYGTGESGRFILSDMTGNETLITTYLGYKTDTLKLRGQKNVTIRMQPMVSALAEVAIAVNTGYQELDKQRATGSFGKPDMEVFKNRTGTPDIIGRLEGLVPGLVVVPGPSGKTGSYITSSSGTQRSLVRGKSTVNLQSEPLYVVNGVQVRDLSNFNPDDVMDITVLKDAAASSIYGVQATNGVIVITTKKGNPYSRIKVNYNGYFNFQNRPNFAKSHMLSSSQYIQAARETFDAAVNPLIYMNGSIVAPHEYILYDQEAHKNDPAYVARTNAQLDSLGRIDNKSQILDLWYQNAVVMNHTLSASGGGDAYNFYTSLSYADNQSTTRGTNNNSYRVNFNQTFSPARRLRISLNTSLDNTLSNYDNSASVPSSFIPYQLFKDANGNNIKLNYLKRLSPEVVADYEARSGINLDYSPVDEREAGYNKRNALTINVTGNVNLNIWKGFSFDGTYGYQKGLGKGNSFKDMRDYDARYQVVSLTMPATATSPIKYLLPITGGRYTIDDYEQRNWTLRNQLVYAANPRYGRDNLSVQIGQEVLENLGKRTNSSLLGYDEDLQTYTLLDYVTLRNGVSGTVTGYGGFYDTPYSVMEELTRNTSLFGLFNYTFNGKYSLDASWRKDKSNLFGSEHSMQRKPTYSVGAKWQLKREEFLQGINWLNDLGLRATYGITGNSPYVGASSQFDILGSSNDAVTGASLYLAIPANDKLSFEKTRTTNIGLDFSLFKNRIGGSVDIYDKKTTDLLGSYRTNPLTGTSSTTGNLGNLNNKGIELSLRTENIQTRNFNWSTNFVFSFNKNKLISYVEPQPYMLTGDGRLYAQSVVGYETGALFAYRFAGLDNMGDPQIQLADGTITKSNEQGTVMADDLLYMGTTAPKFNGGLSNTFRYKNLSIAANMVYSLGHVMRRPAYMTFDGRLTAEGFSGNLPQEFMQRWKKPGDEAFTNIPSFVAGYDGYSRRSTQYYTQADINVIDASYIKLRDVTLSYSFATSILRLIRVEAVNVFVQTGNFMIWKANKNGIDPEAAYDYIAGRAGRTFSIGASVTF